MAGLLFDASALVDTLVADTAPPPRAAYGEYSLGLAVYEVGNALWNIGARQDHLMEGELQTVVDSFVRLMDELTLIAATELSFQGTMTVARDEGLTFYDAAYLDAARRNGYTLVTEDGALQSAAQQYVTAESVADLAE